MHGTDRVPLCVWYPRWAVQWPTVQKCSRNFPVTPSLWYPSGLPPFTQQAASSSSHLLLPMLVLTLFWPQIQTLSAGVFCSLSDCCFYFSECSDIIYQWGWDIIERLYFLMLCVKILLYIFIKKTKSFSVFSTALTSYF